jgi:hypothetical protein
VTLVRAVFPDFLVSYFDATEPEEPAVPDAAITDAAEEIVAEPDERSKAYLIRARLTSPLVSAVVRRLVDELPNLAEAFELTATVQEAIESVNVDRANPSQVQRRLAVLEILFLLQAIAAFLAAGGLVGGSALQIPQVFFAGAVAVPAIAVHGAYLELKRASIRWSLTVELTPGELLRED